MSRRHLFAAVCGGLVLLAAGAVLAESVAYTAPHVVATLEPATATLDGTAFVNQGLVGTGRLAADLHDFNGETLGSFSSLAIERKSWRRMADGSYAGVLYTQPDRGPNNVGGLPTTDYAARLNRFTFVFKPYTGAAALPPTTLQLQLTQAGGMLLRDATGKLFTGRDPQDGMVTRGGIAYPMPPAGDPGAGKISMDAEAVSFLADGSFYVGDEYGPTVYRFDAAGHQVGAIQAGPDVLPMVNGKLNFGADKDVPAGTTGRRGNQGMEGVSASPDGKRLFAVLQSGTLQDNPTDRAVRRNLTRVMVYDISVDRTPKTPMAEYVLELPVYNGSATGTGKASATAAQSEVLALNDTQFLVLSRDSSGRGSKTNAVSFKSILLVETKGATNLVGTPYAMGVTPISTAAAASGAAILVPGITPVRQVELVNMLNTAQLGKFGINTRTAPGDQYSLSEKWEAMGLAPVLEKDRPNDYFLFVGNDNDFISHKVDVKGLPTANTALDNPASGLGENDNVILVYRLTLPTYLAPKP